jgi:hypothetical protein
MKDQLLGKYLPSDDSDDYVLAQLFQGADAYLIYYMPIPSTMLIEDETLSIALVKRLLELGARIIPAPDAIEKDW